VDGGSGSDTFDVTPSASTTDQIDGGGPSTPRRESLTLTLTATSAGGTAHASVTVGKLLR
jgi:hypothetical protein